jgi:hypothetical protein
MALKDITVKYDIWNIQNLPKSQIHGDSWSHLDFGAMVHSLFIYLNIFTQHNLKSRTIEFIYKSKSFHCTVGVSLKSIILSWLDKVFNSQKSLYHIFMEVQNEL